MGRKRKKRLPEETVELLVESLASDGRGVAHHDNKAIFIDGALPGEKIAFRYTAMHRRFDEGKVDHVLTASPHRVEPRCAHADICGGCSLQHVAIAQQIILKQEAALNDLKHIGKVEPETILPPLQGTVWGYRRKARLGVRYVQKKGRVLIGFREKRNSFLADIERCEVIHPVIGHRIAEVSHFLNTLDARQTIPQIELVVSDNTVAIVIRHMEPLSPNDAVKIMSWASSNPSVDVYLQPAGPDSIYPVGDVSNEMYYQHPDHQVKVQIGLQDFFQVNASINHQMVNLALELLALTPGDQVLDLFCGLGNFTLPIARYAAQVTGVEGDEVMVRRAKENARQNGIENTYYFAADLMAEDLGQAQWLKQSYDKILLDPPRSGAKEIIPHIAQLSAKRIVYVSCNPATLARDAGELVHKFGYRLEQFAVMDMFPHTAHVESIAFFMK